MELEAAEALDPRRWVQAVIEARARVERVLDAIESVRETPRDLLSVVLNVRRRVQLFSALIIIGWIALVMTAWIARGGIATGMLC